MVDNGKTAKQGARGRQFVAYLDDVRKRYIAKYAAKGDTSMNDVIREAIDLHRTLNERRTKPASEEAMWWAQTISRLSPEGARALRDAVRAVLVAMSAARATRARTEATDEGPEAAPASAPAEPAPEES